MKKYFSLILALLMLAMIFSGCSSDKESDGSGSGSVGLPEKIFELEEYPKCDGSVYALSMSEAIFMALTGAEPEDSHKYIVHNGNAKALERLLNSEVDIIFIEGNEADVKAEAKERAIDIEIIPIAKEYYVFYTENENNEIDGISSEEARSIAEEKSEIPAHLSAVKCELGYFMSGYIPEKINILAVDGIYPSAENIESGKYPCDLNYYAVIRAEIEAKSNARRLIDALLDEKGQHLIEEAGYVKL